MRGIWKSNISEVEAADSNMLTSTEMVLHEETQSWGQANTALWERNRSEYKCAMCWEPEYDSHSNCISAVCVITV